MPDAEPRDSCEGIFLWRSSGENIAEQNRPGFYPVHGFYIPEVQIRYNLPASNL